MRMPSKKKAEKGDDKKESGPCATEGAPVAATAVGTKEFYAAEDSLADKTTAEHDAESFHRIAENLMTLLAKYREEVKKSNSGSALEGLQIEVMLAIMRLRRLNRLSQFRNKKIRDRVSEERQKVEEQYLQLQNLLYEVSHIEKEVEKCLEFKSDHEDIEMIPVDQFYNEAPEAISKPAVTKHDTHAQRLARLNWELETRKKLESELQKLENEKAELLKQTNANQGQLSTLQPKLEALLEASRPLQEALNMPYEKEAIQREYASCLPPCLYYLYIQALAYKEVFDRHLGVNIEGDLDRVKKMISEKRNEAAVTEGDDDDDDDDSESDSEGKIRDNQHHTQSKSCHQRRKTITEIVQERELDVLDPFPLCVELKTSCKGKATIYLKIHYIEYLGVIGIKSRLELMADVPRAVATANDLLSDDTMLTWLFPEDSGLTCPSPTGQTKLNYSMIDLKSKMDITGRLYDWAQRLAGLVFPSKQDVQDHEENGDDVFKHSLGRDEGASFEQRHTTDDGCQFFQSVLQRIRKRVIARLCLQEQFAVYESLNVHPPKEVSSWFPSRIHSRMTHWSPMTYEDFVSHPAAQTIREYVDEGGWFCSSTVERGPAKLTALIYIPADYPLRATLFCLSLNRKGIVFNVGNCSDLRHLSRAINVECFRRIPKSASNYTLAVQLQFLISRLDVLLEIQSSEQGNKEFPLEHLFQSLRKGPDRQLPFWYNEKRNCFSFDYST